MSFWQQQSPSGGGTAGPTKRSNSETIIYPSQLWFYRKPDVKDMGSYYEVDCFSANNYRWDLNGVFKEIKSVTFVDTAGKSHDVMFLGLDDYFCYQEYTDENGKKAYKRTTGTPSQVTDSVPVSHNKASYWAKPVTLILTIPKGGLYALCVRQACWDKANQREDPTGEKWEDWAERFSDIPLTYSEDIAKKDYHVFGQPGGNYSAGRKAALGNGYYYMNGIIYNMQQYTKYNTFHIIVPAQCIVEWVPMPKPPYLYRGLIDTSSDLNTVSKIRTIINSGTYSSVNNSSVLGHLFTLYGAEKAYFSASESSSMTQSSYEYPEYLWGNGHENVQNFSGDYGKAYIPAAPSSYPSQLNYSSDINYCLLDIGSDIYYPISSDKLRWAWGRVTSILSNYAEFSASKISSDKFRIGVSFYPSGEDEIRVYDYYLPHPSIRTQNVSSTDSPEFITCSLYDIWPSRTISGNDNYTYSITLPEPNFRLGLTNDTINNETYFSVFNKDSAPWAAKDTYCIVGDRSAKYEGHFVLKDNPSLQVSYLSNDYNSYNYYVKITNNDSFPALYYIEKDGASVASTTLGAGVSYDTTISIPREQDYSSPRDISHIISTYSREGGKEQGASQTVSIPNVPRNTMTYSSYYRKGIIVVTRTSHFGSSANETLSSGSYIWQGDVLHVSITNIPSGYSFSKWSTGSTSTEFNYTVGTSSVSFEAQLTRTSYTFSYTLGTGRYIDYLQYRSLNTSGSYGSWTNFTGSKTLYKDDQVQYSIPYSSYYASNSSGSATTETSTITMSSNVSKSFTAAYMLCYFGAGTGATDVVIKVDGTQVTNNAWRWITNTSHNSLYYSCSFKSSNSDWDGNRAYAFNPLDIGEPRDSEELGNDGWSQSASERGLYTYQNNKYSSGYTTSIPEGSGGKCYYCTGARYYAYFRFKLSISLSIYCDWYNWGDKKALYNVYTYCQTYDWSRMSSKNWYYRGDYDHDAMTRYTNLTLQSNNSFTLNNSSNRKWNSSLGFYYFESSGSDGGVGDLCLNGNTTLYYKNNSNLSEGVHTNCSGSGSYPGYGRCNGAPTIYAYETTWTGPDADAYKVAKDIYDNNGPSGHGTYYICEMHPYKSNGCKSWYTESM